MKKLKILFALTVCSLFLVACSSQAPGDRATAPSQEGPPVSSQTFEQDALPEMADEAKLEDPQASPAQEERKQVVSYFLSFESRDYTKALDYLNTLVRENGGFFDTVSESGQAPRYYQATIRIPSQEAPNFTETLKGYKGLIFKNQTKEAQDITTSYVDTELRIETRKKKLARLEELRKNQASLEQLLVLEEEINKTLYEIESLTSSLKSMDQDVTYTTISLSIDELATNISQPGQAPFGERIGAAFGNSLQGFISLIQTLILLVISLIPYLVILGPIGYLVFKKWKKKNTGKKEDQYPKEP